MIDPIRLLGEICSIPTAPFAERKVVEFIEQFVAQRKKLSLSRDRFGNLLIEMKPQRGGKNDGPRWVFAAHMDHPGFVAAEMIDAKTLRADFHGWVKNEFVLGSRVRFFDGGREIRGIVNDVVIEKGASHSAPPRQAMLRVSGSVAAGSPGMFDQGEGRVRGGKFFSRVCDDLAGVAACLAMLDTLAARPARPGKSAPVAVLLSRAEEEGFIGCIAACEDGKLLRKTDRVISIECSARQPAAPQGKGVVIRVGDRTSVFNSGLTWFMSQQAEAMAKEDRKFRWQRALMPGGTCEATVYDIWGYLAGSICVPLGNYHNMDTDRNRIGPEFIDLTDWRNMVKLFLKLAETGRDFRPGHRELKRRIVERYRKLKSLLEKSTMES